MIKVKKLPILLLGVLFQLAFIAGAQTVDMATEVGFMSKSLSPKIDAEGSPYVNEEYLPVKVNGQDIIYSGRYNAYSDEMEIMTMESDSPIALDLRIDYTVTFVNNNKTYKTVSHPNPKGKMVKGFLVHVHSTENFNLFKKENVKFQDKIPAKSSYQSEKPAKFIKDDDVYYLQFKNGEVKMIPNKRKEIHEIFRDKHSELKDFIKEEKIDSDDKDDLIKLINHVESIS